MPHAAGHHHHPAQLPDAAGTVLISVGFVQRDFRTMIGVAAFGLLVMVVLARVVQRRLARPEGAETGSVE